MESFGEYIKNQRELRQVTREEVLGATKVSMHYLEALESDKCDRLPAVPYVVGFLRFYSNYLGLDDDAVVTRYLSCNDKPDEDIFGVAKDLKRKKFKKFLFASFGFLTVLVAILAIFLL